MVSEYLQDVKKWWPLYSAVMRLDVFLRLGVCAVELGVAVEEGH